MNENLCNKNSVTPRALFDFSIVQYDFAVSKLVLRLLRDHYRASKQITG